MEEIAARLGKFPRENYPDFCFSELAMRILWPEDRAKKVVEGDARNLNVIPSPGNQSDAKPDEPLYTMILNRILALPVVSPSSQDPSTVPPAVVGIEMLDGAQLSGYLVTISNSCDSGAVLYSLISRADVGVIADALAHEPSIPQVVHLFLWKMHTLCNDTQPLTGLPQRTFFISSRLEVHNAGFTSQSGASLKHMEDVRDEIMNTEHFEEIRVREPSLVSAGDFLESHPIATLEGVPADTQILMVPLRYGDNYFGTAFAIYIPTAFVTGFPDKLRHEIEYLAFKAGSAIARLMRTNHTEA